MTMGSLSIHIGDSLEDIGSRVLDAVRRSEAGEEVSEDHLTFDSFETLARLLTPKRLELLRYLHRHPAASVRALAQQLGRDYRRVHDDVDALASSGLIDRHNNGTGLTAPWDVIETRLAL
ncbi:MAG: hypothetical protein HQL37_11070 [Alphaproteobacteria bacterium]|nr:hypothetical protein [Alphaproteobacteria bacterium]